jgi:hypothetical protein
MSMDAAVMDLSEVFEFGQGYVALSRVRRFSGLHLLGINSKAWQVHPQILEKDLEFRASSGSAEEKLKTFTDQLQVLQNKFIKACGGKVEENLVVGTKESVGFEKIREIHPNAYRPWDTEQDLQLKNHFSENQVIVDLAKIFGRKPGSIRSRLAKLGLIENLIRQGRTLK